MSNINNISSHGTISSTSRVDSRTSPAIKEPAQQAQVETPSRSDAVELSSAARRLSALSGNENTVRPALVDRIQSEIAKGTYDADAKLDAALDILIDRVIA